MRRSTWVFIWVSVLVGLLFARPASAAPASPSVPPSASTGASAQSSPAQKVCTIDDPRVREVSGLVTLADGGYAVVNDSQREQSAQRIFRLDAGCKYKGPANSVGYQPNSLDPEDLAITPDGTLWSADIGDNPPQSGGNGTRRSTIALWKLPPGGTKLTIYRLTYPDGPHDAEALLLKADGTPIIVTKELDRAAGIYVPSGPLVANTPTGVKLDRVGEFKPTDTHTPNLLGPIGSGVVTGAATAPDGQRVALRTYSDAYEWDVPDGDIVRAITTGKPRITPLPNEPLGESIAYTRDGKFFLTASDVADGPTTILRYTPTAAVVATPKAAVPGTKSSTDKRSFFQRISLQQIMQLVVGIGVLGLVLVIAGVVGIRRSRAARRASVVAGTRGVASVPGDTGDGGTGDGARSPVGSGGTPDRGGTAGAPGSAGTSGDAAAGASGGRAGVPAAAGTPAATATVARSRPPGDRHTPAKSAPGRAASPAGPAPTAGNTGAASGAPGGRTVGKASVGTPATPPVRERGAGGTVYGRTPAVTPPETRPARDEPRDKPPARDARLDGGPFAGGHRSGGGQFHGGGQRPSGGQFPGSGRFPTGPAHEDPSPWSGFTRR